MSKFSLNEQWNIFVKSDYHYRSFTVDLYNFMYCHGGFIAHFDRAGFYKARFCTLNDLKMTLDIMRKDKKLVKLFEAVKTIDYINARLKIAKIEYSLLIQQSLIYKQHADNIKRQYQEGEI